MNKLIAVLVTSLFAVSAFAGSHTKAPAADPKAAAAPAAAPAAPAKAEAPAAPAAKKEKAAKKDKADAPAAAPK